MMKYMRLLLIGGAVLIGCGCEEMREAFHEAMSDDANRSDDPNSEDYKVRYGIGIFEIVRYPRAGDLEKEIQGIDGHNVWINTNQYFSSKNIREVVAVARPGNPDLVDLQFRIDRFGKLQWQILSGRFRDQPVAMVIDGVYFGSFRPDVPEDDESEWVTVRIGLDRATAAGLVKYGKKNYLYYNPDARSWF